MNDDRDREDLPPEAGKKPHYAEPDPPPGDVGARGGYSGEEYDAPGQAEWREKADKAAPSGAVHGSGTGAGGGQEGEDYDLDGQAGGGDLPGAGEAR